MIFFVVAMTLMVFLIMSAVWIAVSVGMAGFVALLPELGYRTFILISRQSYGIITSFTLMAIPLFIFMGEFLGISGVMGRIYDGLRLLLRGVPGGLEQTNIAACGIFAAMSGSSVAGAATMGRVAYPELTKRGYDKKLTLGSVTAGGTLGILIPPSLSFIIYGMIAQESVGQLFMAGLFPGLLLAAMYMVYIAVRTTIQPGLVPKEIAEATPWRVRIGGLSQVWPFLIVMGVVLGTIYFGIATPTESAALGAIGAIAVAVFLRLFTWRKLLDSLLATIRTTSMLFLIMMTSQVTSQALVYYGLSAMATEYIVGIGSPLGVCAFITVLYLFLGCFFEGTAIAFLTLPIFVPAMVKMGFSKVWFGVVECVITEISLLTPPVGLNLFVMQGVTGESLEDIVKGTWPFMMANVALLPILYVLPQLALWLPSTMIQ